MPHARRAAPSPLIPACSCPASEVWQPSSQQPHCSARGLCRLFACATVCLHCVHLCACVRNCVQVCAFFCMHSTTVTYLLSLCLPVMRQHFVQDVPLLSLHPSFAQGTSSRGTPGWATPPPSCTPRCAERHLHPSWSFLCTRVSTRMDMWMHQVSSFPATISKHGGSTWGGANIGHAFSNTGTSSREGETTGVTAFVPRVTTLSKTSTGDTALSIQGPYPLRASTGGDTAASSDPCLHTVRL